jgi:arabinogalactan endo-1,4-beta-galactosidase
VRYERDIIVVETAYPFARIDPKDYGDLIAFEEYPGYPFTPEGQGRMLANVMTIVRAVPDRRGLGVMWWDATWTDVPGNGWDPFDPSSVNNWHSQALFGHDNRALPALSLFASG